MKEPIVYFFLLGSIVLLISVLPSLTRTITMSDPIQTVTIPEDKKFLIYEKNLPPQEDPDDAIRVIKTKGTGMEPEEETVSLFQFFL